MSFYKDINKHIEEIASNIQCKLLESETVNLYGSNICINVFDCLEDDDIFWVGKEVEDCGLIKK